MKTLFNAIRAAIFSAGFIFLWGWAALGVRRRYDGTLGFALAGWTRFLGIAVMAVGGILAFTCVATFVARGEGTPAPFDPPRKFVAAGPYRFVRNPMYIGGFIVPFGFGLYEQSPAILVFTLPWLLLAHLLSSCTKSRTYGRRLAQRMRSIAVPCAGGRPCARPRGSSLLASKYAPRGGTPVVLLRRDLFGSM
jgi:protein-S-isoprenylcysteine O-methyltransferase Ste14